jgi:hypothetical protein
MSSTRKRVALQKPVCPACGNDGTDDEILHIEIMEYRRMVLGVAKGKLRVDADPRIEEAAEGHGYPLFECQRTDCGHRWPVPAEVAARVDFVGEGEPTEE